MTSPKKGFMSPTEDIMYCFCSFHIPGTQRVLLLKSRRHEKAKYEKKINEMRRTKRRKEMIMTRRRNTTCVPHEEMRYTQIGGTLGEGKKESFLSCFFLSIRFCSTSVLPCKESKLISSSLSLTGRISRY
jgi:hypothetical protein